MESLYIYLTFLVIATCKLEISAMNEENKAFLDGHNSLRLKVAKGQLAGQPGASEMKAMIWDDELYKKASDYAATFPDGHNPDHTVPSGRFTTGENLYWGSFPDNDKFNPEKALEAWFGENKDYKYGPIDMSDFDGSKNSIGHYTQMVWSESIYLGCAVTHKKDGPWNKFYVVCNYGPGGNMLGEKPYKEGGPSDKLISGADAA